MNGALQRFGDDVGAAADKDHVLGGGQLFGPGHGGRHLFHRLAAESVDCGFRGQFGGREGALGVGLREDVVRVARQQGQDVRQILVAYSSRWGVAFSWSAT